MPSIDNRAIVAAAGSGKTHTLISSALADPSRQVLITTYTTENLRQIEERLQNQTGGRPNNVTTMTFFEFLLRECVKPFQLVKTQVPNYIRTINFEKRPQWVRYGGIKNFKEYFLTPSGDVYGDYVSQAAVEINRAVNDEVIKRLELLWDDLYIDEAQDMSGYDLVLIDQLLKSRLQIVMVCDPRQAVYNTNAQSKHKKYRGAGFVDWIDERSSSVTRRNLTECYRAVQPICDFADALYPGLPKTTSLKSAPVGRHTGVYLVYKEDIGKYMKAYRPQELRWDRRNKVASPNALNMRATKGLEFPDVLIHLSDTMLKHLEEGAELKDSSLAALYVAITRAEYSVALVIKKTTTQTELPIWRP